MKFRGWLLILLFAHVLVHPLVHAASAIAIPASSAAVLSGCVPSGDGLLKGAHCELCRVGHNSIIAAHLPQIDLLNPRWIRTALQSANYNSLQAARSIPSRAPPTL